MKKTKTAKTRSMLPKLVERSPGNGNLPEFSRVRKKISDLVAREAVEMVGGAVDAAKDGQYGAMKCLFELVGLFPAPIEPAENHTEGLAETLLSRLEIQEAPDLASAPMKNP